MTSEEGKAILESLLFVSNEPLTIKQFCSVLSDTDEKQIRIWLKELANDLNSIYRGIQLVEISHGYRLTSKPQFADYIQKLAIQRQNLKLTRASLETLAVIAYKQPIVRAEIEDIRGVDSGGVLQTLLERKLIKVVGRKEVVGRPLLYGSTSEFLDQFGLKNLNDLPTLDELKLTAVMPEQTVETDISDLSLESVYKTEQKESDLAND